MHTTKNGTTRGRSRNVLHHHLEAIEQFDHHLQLQQSGAQDTPYRQEGNAVACGSVRSGPASWRRIVVALSSQRSTLKRMVEPSFTGLCIRNRFAILSFTSGAGAPTRPSLGRTEKGESLGRHCNSMFPIQLLIALFCPFAPPYRPISWIERKYQPNKVVHNLHDAFSLFHARSGKKTAFLPP